MKMHKRIFFTVALVGTFVFANAQYSVQTDNTHLQFADTIIKAPKNWYHLDYQTDKIRGVSVEKAYAELLANKKSKTVIVAIIDSGIDIDHEDLKDNIWVNSDEIAGNGIDDDKNGYIDDIHGWNFIGSVDGKMIDQDNLETTRLYVKYKKKFEGKSATDFKGKEREEYNLYQDVKKEFEKESQDAKSNYMLYSQILGSLLKADSTIKVALGKDEYTIDELNALESEDEEVNQSKRVLIGMAAMGATVEAVKEGVDYFGERVNYHYNVDFDPRSVVGDNYEDIKEKNYGNNNVKGPDPMHGTHVAGIVGAIRNNNVGMNGIAGDVKIMVIRTVPNGDERDKDVANSIYYAVDNGAKIINMSFGKLFSPYKEAVDKAVKYAEKKGVLLVHGSGNENTNTDIKTGYPNPVYLKSDKKCKTWVEVGASRWEDEDEFVADFSNYGEKTVDLFAPGVEIYSTVPDNKYKDLQGTSMASPVVAGVAALILSYYPELSGEDLRNILIQSVSYFGDVEVNVPGEKGKTKPFKKICSTGGIVNAYAALKLAESYKK